jgi:manganese transport protein
MLQWSLPKIPTAPFCPSEVQGSVSVPAHASFVRKFLAFVGPGLLVAVGYMDPGNWATDIAGGAQFGYGLLSVIFCSNLIAILLQSLCVRLGLVAEQDLAQACRKYFPKVVNVWLWGLAEVAIIACDLAEVLGSALALNLLFHLPLILGALLTGFDLVVVLALQGKGFRRLEAIILGLVATIGLCFGVEIFLAKPDWSAVAVGYVPTSAIVTNPNQLYLAVSILGATVMPHNLYLHSAIVQTRKWQESLPSLQQAIRFATWDSTLALIGALFVNSAILIVAAATFHFSGNQQVAEIQDAYQLLSPLLGTGLASLLFGLALLASGQSSTFTGTIAGQVILEGFLNWRIPCWIRRVLTRILAIAPAVVGLAVWGEAGVGKMLVLSQVILSLQLPFAIVPLIWLTSQRKIMGEFANSLGIKSMAWAIAGLIIGLNLWLLIRLAAPQI